MDEKIIVSKKQWNLFCKELDKPAQEIPKLKKLFLEVRTETWNEEFGDSVILTRENKESRYEILLLGESIKKLFDKYFKLAWAGTTDNNLEVPVKIKARKGAILIEEVKR